MAVQFFDRQDKSNPLNGATIDDKEELLKVLDALRSREPFFCELVGENGYNLLLGVGRDIGCAQYSPSDGSTPYLMAVAATNQDSNEYMDFLTANTPSPVPRRYCVPFEAAKQIAAHFIETGNCWPGVSWEQI
jgi:hypothetical protein